MEKIQLELKRVAKYDKISADDFKRVLFSLANIPDFEAQKVLGVVMTDNVVYRTKLAELLDQAQHETRMSNVSVKKFDQLVRSNAQAISERFLRNDKNMDGDLSVDGFKSAVLGLGDLSDHSLTLPDLDEIFNLISSNGLFKYAEYVIQIDKKMLPFFDKKLKLADESRLGESTITLDYNKTIDHDLKKTTFVS